MRIAILSDIHGNLEALEAVFADVAGVGADLVCSLGDVVGYGPSPAECVDAVRERTAISLSGNHDAAAVGLTPIDDFNEFARSALEWTVPRLDQGHVEYLTTLPYTHRAPDLLLVHASPLEPERWHYIHGALDIDEHFQAFSERLCFVGHTHRASIFSIGPDQRVVRHGAIEVLRPGLRYIVNAGSVGQPRDRDPRACYAVYDEEGPSVELRRVPYDVGKTQARMREFGLPTFLVERLASGS